MRIILHVHMFMKFWTFDDIVIAWAAEAVAPQFTPEAPQPATRAEENIINPDGILFGAANQREAGLSRPAILESFQVAVQDGVSGTSASHLPAKQRKRMSGFPMEDVLNRMHMTKKDAAKELNISATSLKRLCRKNNTNRWPGRKVLTFSSISLHI